ncbi:MAG TPA: HNH endonuclease [Gemmatimonadaceae bacterium]|nr:HNH endonuclease [Gemmatimonadaceae bacterium]
MSAVQLVFDFDSNGVRCKEAARRREYARPHILPAPIYDPGDGLGLAVDFPCPSPADDWHTMRASPEDYPNVYTLGLLRIRKDGYSVTSRRHRKPGDVREVHRLIFDIPPGKVCDHVNRRRDDNRRGNLRAASSQDNARNSIVPRRPNNQGCTARGVVKRPRGYQARINLGGRRIHTIGTFATELEAAAAYDAVAREIHGQFAVLNNIPAVSSAPITDITSIIERAKQRRRAA